MNAADVLLAALVLCVGAALAWRAGRTARIVLFGSALLSSGLLFLPGPQIRGMIGKEAVALLGRWAAATPWAVSEWTHFFIFVWLGALLWLGRPDLRGWKAWGLVVTLAIAAELAQGLTPGREPRMDDVFLNLAGGMGGLLIGIAAWKALERSVKS